MAINFQALKNVTGCREGRVPELDVAGWRRIGHVQRRNFDLP
jgi:hypothetical protein